LSDEADHPRADVEAYDGRSAGTAPARLLEVGDDGQEPLRTL